MYSDWLKIKNGQGILIYSAWQGLKDNFLSPLNQTYSLELPQYKNILCCYSMKLHFQVSTRGHVHLSLTL